MFKTIYSTFYSGNIVNLFIVYELDTCSRDLNAGFTLKDCLFGAVKLTKNADPDKCFYSGYGIGFDFRSCFLIPNFNWGKNVSIFGVENSSSTQTDNRKKDILVIGEGTTQVLDNTTITAKAKCIRLVLLSQ